LVQSGGSLILSINDNLFLENSKVSIVTILKTIVKSNEDIENVKDLINEEVKLIGDEVESAEIKYKDEHVEVWEVRTKQFNFVLVMVVLIVGLTFFIYEIYTCKDVLTNEFGEPVVVNGDLVVDYSKAKSFLFYIELFFIFFCVKEIIDWMHRMSIKYGPYKR
jgi:hypothetical protein